MENSDNLHESKIQIDPTNVIKAAQFILNFLKNEGIQENTECTPHDTVLWLQHSLQHFLVPLSHTKTLELSLIHSFENHLTTLLEATRSMLNCLTYEAQTQLQLFLTYSSIAVYQN